MQNFNPQPPQPPPQRQLPHQRLWPWFRQLSKRAKVIGCAMLILVCSLCVCVSVAATTTPTPTVAIPNATAIPTDTTTTIPTSTPNTAKVSPQVTEYPTDTPAPTQAPSPTQTQPSPTKQTGLTATHGTPHLGGPISDFYGKYGRQITGTVQSGSAPNGSPEESVGWVTDSNNAYFLSVHYYTPSNVVDYIDYVGPSTWSKTQYRDYLISNFAPAGTSENTQANQDWASQGGDPFNPIAYTSDIGKFFLHISDGNGSMNTV